MVFSLFKKSQEKMPERQVARPQPPAIPLSGEKTPGPASPSMPEAAPAEKAAVPLFPTQKLQDEPAALDFTDSQFDLAFTPSSFMAIEVDDDSNPVQVDIEQAAVLFANGQDKAARSMLESCARTYSGADAERLWRMLLDLMQVLGDRAAFETLGMEFAQICETSPPGWRVPDEAPVAASETMEAAVVLQGVLTGGDGPEIGKLKAALAKKQSLSVNFSRLASCDEEAASAFCELLRLARQQGTALELVGADGLVGRLEKRLVTGQRECPAAWLLLLEIYQHQGRPEVFEERAVDYAVTFEVSPPSWEMTKAAAKAQAAPVQSPAEEKVLYLAGELKNYRFDELPNYFESTDLPVLDFSRVKRVDFFSAGQLRNILEPLRRQGREVVIRHPHHLVAELMGIVGVNNVARIVVPKS